MAETMIPGGVVAMTAQAAERLLRLDSGDSALLYLHCLRYGDLNRVSWPESRLNAALEQLRKAGLAPAEEKLPKPAPKNETPPEYALEDINLALDDRASTFPALCDEVERRLDRKLSPNDLKSLFTLYDYLALPSEVILLLVSWCCEIAQRRYGPNRKPTMPMIKKEGFAWARQGIDTMELAEGHIRRATELQQRETQVLRLLDIAPRRLIKQEKDFIAAWDSMGFDDGALRLAYEKTVMKKQSMDWSYMNAILCSWHKQGFHTAEAARAGDRDPRKVRGAYWTPQPAAAENRQSREDMDQLRRMMDEMKQKED